MKLQDCSTQSSVWAAQKKKKKNILQCARCIWVYKSTSFKSVWCFKCDGDRITRECFKEKFNYGLLHCNSGGNHHQSYNVSMLAPLLKNLHYQEKKELEKIDSIHKKLVLQNVSHSKVAQNHSIAEPKKQMNNCNSHNHLEQMVKQLTKNSKIRIY